MTANIVPGWSMTNSSVMGGEEGSRPKSFSATTTCAELDTGSSSARPCTIARMMIFNSDMRFLILSQRVAQILHREALQRCVPRARQRHDLEGFAHLPRHEEPLRLAREPRLRHAGWRARHQLLDIGCEQERRLGRKAGHRQIGRGSRFGNAREVHPGGNVLQADVNVWVVVYMLPEVTAQRAVRAL